MSKTSFWNHHTSRRSVLRAAGLGSAGIAGAALLGCGDGDDGGTAAPTGTAASSGTAAATGTGTAAGPTYVNQDLLSLNDPNMPFPYVFPQEAREPKPGGVYKAHTRYDIAGYDPTKSTSNTSTAVVTTVAQGLVGLEHGPSAHPLIGKVIPRLAKSWEISDDGLTYTFKLNEGVKYQDIAPVSGRDFTAEDVVQVYTRASQEGSASRSFFSNVTSMEAVDDVTLQIKLSKPQPDFLNPLATRIMPIYAIELVDDMNNATKVVGTSAYQLREGIKGEKITFDRNPNYWGTPGHVDSAEWVINPDAAASLALYRVGQVYSADGMVRTISDTINYMKDNPNDYVEISPPNIGGAGFAVNLQNPKYQDPRVRQALALSLDRDAYVASIGSGYGTPRLCSLLPWSFAYDEFPGEDKTPFRKTDHAEAKKLLDAAGATGLEMNAINYYAGDSVVGFYVQSLAQAGVKMTVQNMDLVTFSAQWQTQKFEDTAGGALTGPNFYPNAFYLNIINAGAGNNMARLDDPELSAWSEEQSTTTDPAARREILAKIWEKMETEIYHPLTSPQVTTSGHVWNPIIQNWAPNRAMGAVHQSSDNGTYLSDVWLDL